MKYLLYVISLFSFIASIVIIPNPVGILCVLLLFTTLYNVEIKKTIYKKVYYILLLYSMAYCDIGIAVNRIDHVNYLKSIVDDGQQDEITALAIDNGEDLLNTMSVMTFKKL